MNTRPYQYFSGVFRSDANTTQIRRGVPRSYAILLKPRVEGKII